MTKFITYMQLYWVYTDVIDNTVQFCNEIEMILTK